jgi:hypothetical protein
MWHVAAPPVVSGVVDYSFTVSGFSMPVTGSVSVTPNDQAGDFSVATFGQGLGQNFPPGAMVSGTATLFGCDGHQYDTVAITFTIVSKLPANADSYTDTYAVSAMPGIFNSVEL